jgi:GNAT superfamily N-acetyltransferase
MRGVHVRDIRETQESTEINREDAQDKDRLSETGRRAMQGRDTYHPRPDDTNFTDAQGRPITIRTFSLGDQRFIRAYDCDKKKVPENPAERIEYAGNIDLLVKPDLCTNQVERAKIQEIHTHEDYRKNGIGGAMLKVAEQEGRQAGAREIYGSLTPGQIEQGSLHDFYTKRGYKIRPSSGGGAEIYKSLQEET